MNTTAAETTPVEMNIAASLVRKGDLIATRANGLKRIAEIKVGTTRVTARDSAGARLLYVMVDDMVDIVREVETEESVERRVNERLTTRYESMMANAQESTAAALADVTREVTENGAASHWELERLMVAQTENRIWKHVAAVLEDNETAENIIDAVGIVARQYERDIVRSASRRMSRSTSMTSNLVEDIEIETKAEFLELVTRGY